MRSKESNSCFVPTLTRSGACLPTLICPRAENSRTNLGVGEENETTLRTYKRMDALTCLPSASLSSLTANRPICMHNASLSLPQLSSFIFSPLTQAWRCEPCVDRPRAHRCISTVALSARACSSFKCRIWHLWQSGWMERMMWHIGNFPWPGGNQVYCCSIFSLPQRR